MRSLFAIRSLGLLVLCTLWALTMACPEANAQQRRPSLLNPRTVVSPSGEYTLWIDPSEPYGSGEATYRLKRKGRRVWEGTRPFTLYEARVTNDGTVGGYAYSHGLEGMKAPPWEDGGDFDVVLLAPNGRTRLLQKTQRVGCSGPDFRVAYPHAEGLTVDAAQDRMIVRVTTTRESGESWWLYQLSTGRVLPPQAPQELLQSEKEPDLLSVETPMPFNAPIISLALRDRIELRAPGEGMGEAPPARPATEIREVAVRPDGWILAIDARAGAVNLFDARGVWRAVRPSQQLAKEARLNLHFQVRQIELGPKDVFSIQGEQFDREGNSQGIVPGFSTPSERARAIKRRPDERWLESVTSAAAAPDGALALLESGGSGLSLYSARNRPERRIALPPERLLWQALAYGDTQIVVAGADRLLCYDRKGKPRWQCTLPKLPWRQNWTPFFTEAGHTLCLFDGDHTLYRYAMP